MDEPTAGQDYANYMAFMDAILQMQGFEAVLFITHDVDLAIIYANRVILMVDGQHRGRRSARRGAGRSGQSAPLPPGAHLAAGAEPGVPAPDRALYVRRGAGARGFVI